MAQLDPRSESIRALAAMLDAHMKTNDDGGDGGDGGDQPDGGQDDTPSGGEGGGGKDSGGKRSAAENHIDQLLNGKGSDRDSGTNSKTGTGNGTGKDADGEGDDDRDGFSDEGRRILDAVTDRMDKLGQSIADRLVNAQGKQLRKNSQGDRDRDDRTGKDTDRGKDGDRQRDDDGPSVADRREAETELRLELRDVRPRGASKADRAMAEALGARFLADNLADGQRPVRAARAAAESAHTAMEDFAKTIREETVASLRKRGALVDGAGTGRGGGSAPAGGAGRAASTEDQAYARGQSMAERFNTQNGHAPAKTG